MGYNHEAEHTKSLDVNPLQREGCQSPGRRGHWVCSIDGAETGRIGYHAKESHLELDYKVLLWE